MPKRVDFAEFKWKYNRFLDIKMGELDLTIYCLITEMVFS